MKKLFNEFKEFAFRGNVFDMAIGMMIGTAIGAIVTSLVNDIFMPVINIFTGKANFSDLEVKIGKSVLHYGNFITAVINFLLVALCVFIIFKIFTKLMSLKKKEEVPAKEPRKCPYCFGEVHDEATRCMHCGSELPPVPAKEEE